MEKNETIPLVIHHVLLSIALLRRYGHFLGSVNILAIYVVLSIKFGLHGEIEIILLLMQVNAG